MRKKILWIEDDYYAIKGLVRPIEQKGYTIDIAINAYEGYKTALNWKDYDLIIVDLILPLSDSHSDNLPEIVKSWENKYAYVGVGIIKWLFEDLGVKRPVLICSVVRDPISNFSLGNLGVSGYISKSGLLPSKLKDEVFRVLGVSD